MQNYDWIVIGGGITGSALSYELVKKGLKVLLLEKDAQPNNATYYSYGGLAYWSGTTPITHQLLQEGIEIHRKLSEELEATTEFREIDLLLTIDPDINPEIVAETYTKFAIQPQLLDVQEACQLEPLLNKNAISGALKLPHAHIHPHQTNNAYQKAFLRLGGDVKIEQARQVLCQGERVIGVTTSRQNYYAENTVICAGGLSRSLLQKAGIKIKLYFSHAQLIKTPPVEIKLRSLVMPAIPQRLILEEKVSQSAIKLCWENPSSELIAETLEPGAIQFIDGSFLLGQVSQIRTDPHAKIDPITSEAKIRAEVGRRLPSLQNLPGTWHCCLVAFANLSQPLMGQIPDLTGIYLFTGFTSTLIFAPPLARHFARWVTGEGELPLFSSK